MYLGPQSGAEGLGKRLTEREGLAATPGRENCIVRTHSAWGRCCKGTMKMALQLSSLLICGSQHCPCQLVAGCLTFSVLSGESTCTNCAENLSFEKAHLSTDKQPSR